LAKTYIHFVRHGKVYNPIGVVYERLDGFNLSAEGKKQANITAKFLYDKLGSRILTLFTSPLLRTRESIEPLEELANIKAIEDERVIESTNFFKGRKINPRTIFEKGNFRKLLNPFKPSWGEPYKSIEYRMVSFLQDIVTSHSGENIVVCSHELPIFILRRYFESKGYFHNPRHRRVFYSSITTFIYDDIANDVIDIRYIEPS
jgi:broad specificity phosphatase PhoE